MSNKLVSVIIPVYNVEQFLRRCLESIVNQTLKDIEVICINDGSSDNSPKILREYAAKDARLKVIDFAENKGVSQARNAGFEAATGEHVYFMDSDDWLGSDYLASMFAAITKTIQPVIHNRSISCIYEVDKINSITFKRPPIGFQSVRNCSVVMWSYFFKKSYLDKFKPLFPEMQARKHTDLYFYYTAVVPQKEVYVVEASMYYHFRHMSSLAINLHQRVSDYFDIFEVAEKIYEFYRKNNLLSDIPFPISMFQYHIGGHKFKEEFFDKMKVFLEKIKADVLQNWHLYDSADGLIFKCMMNNRGYVEYQKEYLNKSAFWEVRKIHNKKLREIKNV